MKLRWTHLALALALAALTACAGRSPLPLAFPAPAVAPTPNLDLPVTFKKYPGNYTAFKIVKPGLTIVTDPYQLNENVVADIVTESHDDLDHSDTSRVDGSYRLLQRTGQFVEHGIKVTGIAGMHDKGDKPGTNRIYVFDLNGMRIAQFGSQGQLPDDAMYAEIGHADVVILQVFGEVSHPTGNTDDEGRDTNKTKLSVSEAHTLINRVQAKVVIPAHGDPTENKNLALELGTTVEKHTDGMLALTPRDLASQTGVRVVDLDN